MLPGINNNLQYVYGYLQKEILNDDFLNVFQVLTDENDIPVWGIVYYGLQSGMV